MTSDLPPTGGSQPSSGTTSAQPSGPASRPLPPTGPSGQGTDDFFTRIRSAGVTRPDEGRWVAGVAAGLARRWDLDPVLVRGGFVALSIFGGIGVLAYGLAWLLLPQDDGRIHLQQAVRGDVTAGFIGAAVLSLVAVGGGGRGPWHDGFWFGWGFPGGLVLAALVIFGVWWLYLRSDGSGPATSGPGTPGATSPDRWAQVGERAAEAGRLAGERAAQAGRLAGERASEASRRAGEQAVFRAQQSGTARALKRAGSAPSRLIVRLTLGIALLVAAAILAIGNAQDWDQLVGLIAAAAALAVIAAGVIISGLNGRRAAGLTAIGLLLAVGTLAGAGAENAGVRSGQNVTLVGDRAWTPATRAEAESQFNLGVGQATLWLSDPAVLSSATGDPVHVRVRVGAGHLVVVLPDGVPARLDLQMGAGEVVHPDGSTYDFNGRDGGDEQSLVTGPSGDPRMIVDVEQGAGQVEIRTASQMSGPPAGTSRPVPTVTSGTTPEATATPGATPTATATATATK